MNRASRIAPLPCLLGLLVGIAAGPTEQDPAGAQADPIGALVAGIRDAESRLTSVRTELETMGTYPGGLEFQTEGTLHVLRGEQPRMRATVTMRFADGLEGFMDSSTTSEGVTIYQDDPAFGEVYLHVSPVIVRDLQWAGTVLDRSDLPGMRDARSEAPLGSSMVDGLRREFALAMKDEKHRGADAGVWLAGERRPGLGDVDAELPLASRVELFVRDRDHALLEVVHYQGERVVQRITVRSLEVDTEIPAEAFAVPGRGQPLRDVEKHVPLWTAIQDVLARAEAKLLPPDLAENEPPPPHCLRPSRRPK